MFEKFITEPPVYHCPHSIRVKKTLYCDNCDCILDKYFSNANLAVCIHCFLTIHTFAAIRREEDKHKPKHPIIDGVKWNTPNEKGEFLVTFRNNTFLYLSEAEIKDEIRRQELREGGKDSINTATRYYIHPNDDDYDDVVVYF